MADYYGVSRSSDYLQHYGVKGMRWGVRKAREDSLHPSRPHSLGFSRIRKKLADIQKRKVDKEVAKVQGYAAKGKNRKLRKAYESASERMEELRNNANRDYQRGQADQNTESSHNLKWYGEGGAIMGNRSWRVLNAIDKHKSKKRLTDKGHAAAVKERNAYARQMQRMFANTEYDTRRKKRR